MIVYQENFHIHQVVNNSENFVDPFTGKNIQYIL